MSRRSTYYPDFDQIKPDDLVLLTGRHGSYRVLHTFITEPDKFVEKENGDVISARQSEQCLWVESTTNNHQPIIVPFSRMNGIIFAVAE